ncbi:hypothetical protein NE615_27490, partial [Escherichia coli]|nr:hypothetical protein [Escherichia coli]
MAGLPNSSNVLQQWHHLFEAEGTKRSPQAQQHLQQLSLQARVLAEKADLGIAFDGDGDRVIMVDHE